MRRFDKLESHSARVPFHVPPHELPRLAVPGYMIPGHVQSQLDPSARAQNTLRTAQEVLRQLSRPLVARAIAIAVAVRVLKMMMSKSKFMLCSELSHSASMPKLTRAPRSRSRATLSAARHLKLLSSEEHSLRVTASNTAFVSLGFCSGGQPGQIATVQRRGCHSGSSKRKVAVADYEHLPAAEPPQEAGQGCPASVHLWRWKLTRSPLSTRALQIATAFA